MELFYFDWFMLATILCDFEKKESDKSGWCNFHHNNNGDNSSIAGFEWMRHSGKWIQDKNLDGPYKGNKISNNSI